MKNNNEGEYTGREEEQDKLLSKKIFLAILIVIAAVCCVVITNYLVELSKKPGVDTVILKQTYP